MSATKGFNRFRKCLSNFLESKGFFASDGEIFSRPLNDTQIVLEIQKDRKRGTKEQIFFTINVGISVDAIRMDPLNDAGSYGSLSPTNCHWRQRVGRLLPGQTDLWWSIRDEHSFQSLCDEIAAGLLEHALPKIVGLASSDSLMQLWLSDRGPGLTEYERRSNLARLLAAKHLAEEASIAIKALEDAAVGKPWEVSARIVSTQLRKQLASVSGGNREPN